LLEIEQGLQADAFDLHYQPVVPITRNEPVSLEALLSWRHPERGLLAPGGFQEGFADPATCTAFGKFGLERVSEDAAGFKVKGVQLQRIAINVTSADFQSTVFVDTIFAFSHQTGIGLDQLCIEVTEGMFVNVGHDRIEQGLHRLPAAGVEIALDDFGTGHASMTSSPTAVRPLENRPKLRRQHR
jgi:EAL domain-containing protein (putative c-di-GMP-specific phosphodiesterase class I)